MATRVMWELSEEGKVLVDVDAPLRPFGSARLDVPRTNPADKDGTEPDGAPVDEVASTPKVPKP
jgi:hypothetical protein